MEERLEVLRRCRREATTRSRGIFGQVPCRGKITLALAIESTPECEVEDLKRALNALLEEQLFCADALVGIRCVL